MKIVGGVTSESVLEAGQFLVLSSMVTGITIFLYFLHTRHMQALRLVADHYWLFAKNAMPYITYLFVCWCLSLTFGKLIASSRLIMNITAQHYLMSKVILNVTAVVAKYHLFCTRRNSLKIVLFVGNLILMATSEAMSPCEYKHKTIKYTIALLLWLTVLILVRHINIKCISEVPN